MAFGVLVGVVPNCLQDETSLEKVRRVHGMIDHSDGRGPNNMIPAHPGIEHCPRRSFPPRSGDLRKVQDLVKLNPSSVTMHQSGRGDRAPVCMVVLFVELIAGRQIHRDPRPWPSYDSVVTRDLR